MTKEKSNQVTYDYAEGATSSTDRNSALMMQKLNKS